MRTDSKRVLPSRPSTAIYAAATHSGEIDHCSMSGQLIFVKGVPPGLSCDDQKFSVMTTALPCSRAICTDAAISCAPATPKCGVPFPTCVRSSGGRAHCNPKRGPSAVESCCTSFCATTDGASTMHLFWTVTLTNRAALECSA